MTGRPPTADRQDADGRDGSRDSRGLSVAEAADRLGVTPDAVRGRLHRGTLAGEKAGTEWRVFLPDAEAPTAGRQGGQQATPDARQDATDGRQATDRPGDGALATVIADLARRNEELAAAAAMWQSRAAHLEHRLAALTAGEGTDGTEGAPAPYSGTPPVSGPLGDPPAAPGRVGRAHEGRDTPAPERRPWWRRLLGGDA